MNLTATQQALRDHALTLSVATMGSATLAATATGYTRSSGSFVTDGFLAGMEILPAGFTTNTPRVVQSVAAATLTVRPGTAAVPIEAAAAGRSLVCGLPSIRAYDNQRASLLPDRWAVEEDFTVQPQRLRTMAGANGTVERRGLYVLRLYCVQGPGFAACAKVADAVLALFLPETTLAVSGGETVRIRGDVGPWRSGFLTDQSGWAALTVTVPWWMLALNS